MTTGVGQLVLFADRNSTAKSEVLLWDGRLDNRDELLQSIRYAGARPSPEAAVLAAYERDGIRGLGEVVGDWSIVIFDCRRNLVLLASDYAGVRPLYYAAAGGIVRWALRPDSLVESECANDLDEDYVRSLLARGGGAHRTPFRGIFAVPAGHAVCVSRHDIQTVRFWEPPTRTPVRYADEREYDDQLQILFADAVRVRLQTNSPVVAELSGGLDSASVVGMADRLLRHNSVPAPSLTTVSFVHRDSTDVPFIQAVEALRGPGLRFSTHVDPLVSRQDAGGSTPGGWGPLYRAVVGAMRERGARVLLTGQNGDLAMGNWFDDSLQVAAAIRRGKMRQSVTDALVWSRRTRVPMPKIFARALLAALPSWLTPHDLYASEAPVENSCLTPAFCRRTAAAARPTVWMDDWTSAPPERRSHFRALAHVREMRSLQRLEYAPDIDYTHPFAHRPLVEFLMSIPAEVLCRAGEPRRLMRRSLQHLWPAPLRGRRSKSLFGAPWIEALRPLAADMLSSPRWQVVERGWIDRAHATNRLQRLVHGIECDDVELRHMILLEHWIRHRERAVQGRPAA